MLTNQEQINPPRKNKQNLNHVCSHYWNLPKTSTNSVNFPDNPQPTQDYTENYPFFQQNKNNQNTPFNTNYLSSDEDDYHQPDIFAPYTKEYRTQRPRQPQPSRNKKFTHKTQQMYNIHNKCIYKTHLTHNLFNQYNHKIQCQCILINQLKCKMKYRFHITFSNTK